MSNKKHGFTLAETLIVMTILGVIAAILIPIAGSKLPNEEQLMFKKAYNLTGRIISELVNDSDYYWESTSSSDGEGFANTSAPVDMDDYSGDAKFCKLFAKAMNTSTVADCTAKTQFVDNNTPSAYTFKTNDGMVWQLPITNFGGSNAGTSSAAKWYNIVIDVNGNKGGNCFDDGGSSCQTPDRFIIQVDHMGAMNAPGTLESVYLSSNKVTKRYKEIVSEKGTSYKSLKSGGVVSSLAAGPDTADDGDEDE